MFFPVKLVNYQQTSDLQHIIIQKFQYDKSFFNHKYFQRDEKSVTFFVFFVDFCLTVTSLISSSMSNHFVISKGRR